MGMKRSKALFEAMATGDGSAAISKYKEGSWEYKQEQQRRQAMAERAARIMEREEEEGT